MQIAQQAAQSAMPPSAPAALAPAPPERKYRRRTDPLVSQIAERASLLGFEAVDFAGFIEDLDRRSVQQKEILAVARANADDVITANAAIADVVEKMRDATTAAAEMIQDSVERVHTAGRQSTEVVRHIVDMADQMTKVMGALDRVRENNDSISDIAIKVNMLAINARIEATRAGDAGAGFATIASAINELAASTAVTAKSIGEGIEGLNDTLRRLADQSATVRNKTDRVIRDTEEADTALGRIATSVGQVRDQASDALGEATKVRAATDSFAPAFESIATSIDDTAGRISDVRARSDALVEHSESMVQDTVDLGGATADLLYIDRVKSDAAKLSGMLEQAIQDGRITEADLFSRSYDPIPNTDPPQVLAPFTHLTDQMFPPLQEAALELSDKVVFCAAVNLDGYLPTHNRKFSKRQGPDVAWNTAHCRNRRIFDDRAGLKSGRNTRPFLLQVYRRDMGNGKFILMKDASAPIIVNGRHWGGLRLAYHT